MNARLKAKSAYAAARVPAGTARNLEYEALARITHRMLHAARQGKDSFGDLAQALTDNRRLWTIFSADLLTPGNSLPQDLKGQLLDLARFTTQHTSKVLARQADVRPLIEINTAIMRGLRSGAN